MAQETNVWPFGTDADRDDPLTAHRIAVTSSHPGWYYLVSFDRQSEARPTDHETALLVSYLDHYKDYWYGRSGFRAEMEERALDVDGGANGAIFHKWGTDDWGYRRQSYRCGPLFWPGPPFYRRQYPNPKVPARSYSLVELMDYMQTFGDDLPVRHWREWKASNPEVFGVEASRMPPLRRRRLGTGRDGGGVAPC